MTGQVVSSLALIARAWVSFYVRLFTADALDVSEQDFFLNHITRCLSSSERALCEGPLTFDKCQAAVDAMAHGKSPGLDGFPAEFYQRFWPLLGRDYVDVMNSCYSHGCLSPSQRTGLITLLYKRGDRLDMKNWRPITLLCVDYKIASKALANRLLLVLPSLISPDQSCGIKGRNPAVNTRLLHDIVLDINQRGSGGAVLSLDQEKAFDRVDWSYLLRILAHMNCGESFCTWISLLYTNISSSILINGTRSDSFFFSRGVRQGWQLSFHGRALLANSLGLSLLWYLASFIAMPDMVVRRVNSLLFSFLWQEKRELVARSSLTQPSRLGGLGVVDVQSKVSALHVMWVRRFLEARGHPSAFFFWLYIRVAFAGRSVDQVLLLPAPSNPALRLLPPFYRSIMVAWFRLSRRMEDGEIVVAGAGTSFCPVRSLTVHFVYRQLLSLGHTEHRCVSRLGPGCGLEFRLV